MSKPNVIYWGNLPHQNVAPEFLAYLQSHYPELQRSINESLALNPNQVGPEIPMNIDGNVVSVRKVQGIWKLYGPSIPQCKIASLINVLTTCMQIR